MKYWADWAIRAAKTFVQSFLGVMVPAFCAILAIGWPESFSKLWIPLIPTIPAALASGIAAVWNIILEDMRKHPEVTKPPDTDTPPEWEPTSEIKHE